ncbi:MAG: 16S rRNA (cytosine(1402)-N(4))-methyltransferase RsmH [Lysobacterales bacterium]
MENTGQLWSFTRHVARPQGYGRIRLRGGRWNMSEAEQQSSSHIPVLLKPAVDALVIDPNGTYLDGTFGRGGHSQEVLHRLGPGGRLLALDRDPEALAAGADLASRDERLVLRRAAFAGLAEQSQEFAPLTGVLLDIGVSSPQLDDAERGFSFMADGPLDMRMDPDSGVPVAQWLVSASEQQIATTLKTLGEERHAKRIARAIKQHPTPLTRTAQLAELVQSCVPRGKPGKHPATRTFQALRIAVNQELEQLEQALNGAYQVLAPGGRLVVISFHSLEDRIVKQFIRRHGASQGNRRLPPGADLQVESLRPVGKAVKASDAECDDNPRARSAVMRVAERVGS